LMASLQGSLRSWASSSGGDEARTIRNVNRQLHALTGAARFATLFWGVYDAERRELAYVNAGHNPPMLLRKSDGFPLTTLRLSTGGTVLGMFPDAPFERGISALEPDDLVVLFSDGIPEAPSADVEFGEGRLETFLRANVSLPPAELCERVLAEVRTYLGEQPSPDDLTIVVLKVR
ncbi:MAG TPA: SpoIIE family protein phosphatase, partial [Thermoanaerobaculia bacterium]|nr:SpoIIE family protein phosphatase [Thermoanaerobaculia bacterium]